METRHTNDNRWLHRFAVVVAASTLVLIFVGGLVTSTGSGLAVPDWPNTYGHFMFSFPMANMVGGILYEHGHRLIASIVGMLTVILTAWVWLTKQRPALKWLASTALFAVIAQGILGGVTVIYQLPTTISVLHGCLAQGFFMLTVAIVVLSSHSWEKVDHDNNGVSSGFFTLTVLTTSFIYIQLILGAIMRHSGAGLAIPDFPFAFGKLIPPMASKAIAIHFLHRAGALLVTILVVTTFVVILRSCRYHKRLVRIGMTLLISLILQIALAALTIWSRKAVIPTTAHVTTGAFILATSLYLTLWARRISDATHQPAAQTLGEVNPAY